MGQSTEKNRRIVLASRPEGAPTKDIFRLEEISKPVPGEGELLLHSIYLSLDTVYARPDERCSIVHPPCQY